jgi:hypothetical protein
MYEKYAFIEGGITAYSDAGPVSGNVPPIVMVRLVIPVSDAAEVAPDAVTPIVTTSAAAKSRTFFIELPPWECRLDAASVPPLAAFANTQTPGRRPG